MAAEIYDTIQEISKDPRNLVYYILHPVNFDSILVDVLDCMFSFNDGGKDKFFVFICLCHDVRLDEQKKRNYLEYLKSTINGTLSQKIVEKSFWHNYLSADIIQKYNKYVDSVAVRSKLAIYNVFLPYTYII